METFLIICKEVIYTAKLSNLDLENPKIKVAIYNTIYKQLHY